MRSWQLVIFFLRKTDRSNGFLKWQDQSHYSPANGPIFHLTELAPLAKKMGFDGLELACWGDHFDVYKAAESGDYCRERWKILGGCRSHRICYFESSRRAGDLR